MSSEAARERLKKLRAKEKKEFEVLGADDQFEEVEEAAVPPKDKVKVAAKSALKAAMKSSPPAELRVDAIEPNDWNPNVVEKTAMNKLRNGIKLLLDQGVRPPPIVVREKGKGQFEIIDGFHRWTIFKEMKQETVPAVILNVDDKTARILTDTLNYLRGEPDEEKYSELVADLLMKQGASIEELADLLPESIDELQDILAVSASGLKALLLIDEQERSMAKEADDALNDENTWLDVTFRVSRAQARVIENEITRIEGTLDGKNRRGRALEYMAAQSATTPLEDQHPAKPKKAKKKEAA